MNMFKLLKISAITVGTTLLPILVYAQKAPIGVGPQSAEGAVKALDTIAYWFQLLIFGIAVIMILVAAFQFITAGGNEEKVAGARKSLMWGLIGLAVALFAYVAVPFMKNAMQALFGGSSGSNTQLQPDPGVYQGFN